MHSVKFNDAHFHWDASDISVIQSTARILRPFDFAQGERDINSLRMSDVEGHDWKEQCNSPAHPEEVRRTVSKEMSDSTKLTFLLSFLLILPLHLTATTPHITSSPLTKKQIHEHFGSNNPIKKLLFTHKFKAHNLVIINHTDQPLLLKSNTCTPAPLQPGEVDNKLSQSMAAAPWLIGAGWAVLLTKVIGFAIVPSIMFGATVILAGVIGMNNSHLPAQTQHTITHLLIDGVHDYLVPAHDHASLIIILPCKTKQLSISYSYQDSNARDKALIEL